MDKKIVIVGAYGGANLGDDALMTAMITLIRQAFPMFAIYVRLGRKTEYPSKWFPDVTFISDETLHKGMSAYLLLYGGGTQFCSFKHSYTKRLTAKLSKFREYLHLNILKQKINNLKSSPTISANYRAAISIGIGPFEGSKSKESIAQQQLRSCNWVSVRDDESYRHCQQFGLVNVKLHSDLCYVKDLWTSTTVIYRDLQAPKRIGIIIRDWPYNKKGMSYFSSLEKAVHELRLAGYETSYISFAPLNDDKLIAHLNRKGEKILIWVPDKTTLSEFVATLSSFDIFVSARAHGLIIGAVLGIPSIAIEIEPKLRVISQQLQHSSLLWSDPYDYLKLLQLIEHMRSNWKGYCESVRVEATANMRSALAGAQELTSYINSVIR